MVTEMEFDEEGNVEICLIEAILSKREEPIDWHVLKDQTKWLQGWK